METDLRRTARAIGRGRRGSAGWPACGRAAHTESPPPGSVGWMKPRTGLRGESRAVWAERQGGRRPLTDLLLHLGRREGLACCASAGDDQHRPGGPHARHHEGEAGKRLLPPTRHGKEEPSVTGQPGDRDGAGEDSRLYLLSPTCSSSARSASDLMASMRPRGVSRRRLLLVLAW